MSFRGTRDYVADEYFDGELSTKLDVLSLGVVTRCITAQKSVIIHLVVEAYTGLTYDSKRPTKHLVTQIHVSIVLFKRKQVHLIRHGLYDLEEFMKLCDNKIRSRMIPDLEPQSLCRKMLALRVDRIEMVEVSLGCLYVTLITIMVAHSIQVWQSLVENVHYSYHFWTTSFDFAML